MRLQILETQELTSSPTIQGIAEVRGDEAEGAKTRAGGGDTY